MIKLICEKPSKYMCREEKFMLYITLLFAFRGDGHTLQEQ